MSVEGHDCGPNSCPECGEVHDCICGHDCQAPTTHPTNRPRRRVRIRRAPWLGEPMWVVEVQNPRLSRRYHGLAAFLNLREAVDFVTDRGLW